MFVSASGTEEDCGKSVFARRAAMFTLVNSGVGFVKFIVN